MLCVGLISYSVFFLELLKLVLWCFFGLTFSIAGIHWIHCLSTAITRTKWGAKERNRVCADNYGSGEDLSHCLVFFFFQSGKMYSALNSRRSHKAAFRLDSADLDIYREAI